MRNNKLWIPNPKKFYQINHPLLNGHKAINPYAINMDSVVINIVTKEKLEQYVYGGYYCVTLQVCKNGIWIDKTFKVHRLLLMTLKPIKNPHLYHGHHIDRNKLNNTYPNLEWLTPSEHAEEHRGENVDEVKVLYRKCLKHYGRERMAVIFAKLLARIDGNFPSH
jgi:hypothetical protein